MEIVDVEGRSDHRIAVHFGQIRSESRDRQGSLPGVKGVSLLNPFSAIERGVSAN